MRPIFVADIAISFANATVNGLLPAGSSTQFSDPFGKATRVESIRFAVMGRVSSVTERFRHLRWAVRRFGVAR